MPRLLPRRSVPDATRVGVLARMRVGTKLMLLVLLPVCAVLIFASIAAVDDWRDADRLRDFRSATRLSFASARAVEAVAGERMAATLRRLRGGSADRRRTVAVRRATDAALRAAAPQPSERAPIDVEARLRTARRELITLRRQATTGSLGLQEMVEQYGVIARSIFGIVRDLDSGRPSRASGRAADAYVALVQAVEAAEMERASLAAALVRGTEAVRVRGVVLEAAALDTFRQYASPRLVAELDELLSEPPAATVERVRNLMIRDPASVPRRVSLARWLAVSGRRTRGLRRLETETAGELTAVASADLDAAEGRARRAVAASVGVLIIVLGLGLVLRQSITRPLGEVSRGARMLSAGELASGVSYVGRDEIGDVAAAFRDLQGTAERVAEEIRAINLAVEDNRLGHRADVAAFDGRWAELMHGINHTMSAFAELQGRREQAERHADRIFEMSQDLLCIAGFDGYFKRVNPAFERVLGYSAATLLSRPTEEFVHPEDRMARLDGYARLESGENIQTFELRQLCRDRSTRRIEWSARAVPEQGLIYAVGRDVTDSQRAAAEQAALRRVATLVAKGVAPAELFAAASREVRALFEADSAGVVRVGPDGSVVVLGSAPDGSTNTHADVAAAVTGAGSATRTDREVGAPIVVEDRLWGVVTVSRAAESLPPGTEERLARFTDLVATAIANAESRAEVAASRVRVVATAGEERRRVVRDLHDGAQQHLVHTILTLKLASRAHEEDNGEASALVTEALEQAERAMDELRELSRGILPTALTSGGLRVAVETLASRMPLPVETDVSARRFPPVVEATAYFVVSEALTNVVKHADAARADVSLHVEDDTLHISVRDDGVGGAQPDGSGLVGLRDRLEALEGRLRIESPPGRGTRVAAKIPLSGHPIAKATPTAESATSANT